MPECVECGAYTKFANGHCYDCYHGIRAKEKNHKWNDSIIKGRIAETIVEQLFYSLNFEVYKYGMENTIPGIMSQLKRSKSRVASRIRKMPDFVVFKDGRAHFIEVKYRTDERFSIDDLEKKGHYPYPDALIVVVSKKHIKCLSYEDLENGKEITPNCHNFLGNRKEFETDKEVIISFCDYAKKFFTNED